MVISRLEAIAVTSKSPPRRRAAGGLEPDLRRHPPRLPETGSDDRSCFILAKVSASISPLASDLA